MGKQINWNRVRLYRRILEQGNQNADAEDEVPDYGRHYSAHPSTAAANLYDNLLSLLTNPAVLNGLEQNDTKEMILGVIASLVRQLINIHPSYKKDTLVMKAEKLLKEYNSSPDLKDPDLT